MAVPANPDSHAAITRRQLVAWSATAGLAVTLRGLVTAPRAVAREIWLRRASYAGRVGHVMVGGATSVRLRLLAVQDLVGTAPSGAGLAGRDDGFLLEFRGPPTPRLSQGVVEMHHPDLGRQQLFLVPQAPGRRGNAYAVVVNRAR